MNDDFTVANIIKRYMRLRNKSQKEIAGELNMNYKTLSGILNRYLHLLKNDKITI